MAFEEDYRSLWATYRDKLKKALPATREELVKRIEELQDLRAEEGEERIAKIEGLELTIGNLRRQLSSPIKKGYIEQGPVFYDILSKIGSRVSCPNMNVTASIPQKIPWSVEYSDASCSISVAGGGGRQVACAGFDATLQAPSSMTVIAKSFNGSCHFVVIEATGQ